MVKNLHANPGDTGSIPELGRFPGEGNAYPLQYSCLENCMDRGAWWATVSVQFSSVAQSCPTLCDPVNRSTSGLPVHHQLPEFTQTHVHQVGDASQPSHLLLQDTGSLGLENWDEPEGSYGESGGRGGSG